MVRICEVSDGFAGPIFLLTRFALEPLNSNIFISQYMKDFIALVRRHLFSPSTFPLTLRHI